MFFKNFQIIKKCIKFLGKSVYITNPPLSPSIKSFNTYLDNSIAKINTNQPSTTLTPSISKILEPFGLKKKTTLNNNLMSYYSANASTPNKSNNS
jgi:hypothetical protein